MADPVYGFNKQDADNLLNSIEGTQPENLLPGSIVHYLRLYGFTLTSNMSSNTASATIATLNPIPTTFTNIVITYLAAFSSLEAGDTGLCVYQDNQFIVIQADC